MASEILGLFTTPEQYQLAQQQAQQAQAIQYANLDPMARANYGTFRAGQQLGGAIGGALGGQDPQLKMISMRQQLASQLNPNDPESYMKIAEIAAQSGDQQFAIAVADAGRKAMSEFALIQQRTRERQGADPFQQIIRSGKYTPASLSAYEKSKNVADLVLLEKEATSPAKIQEAERVARSKGFTVGTPEFESEVATYLQRPEKAEPRPSVGSDREGISLDLFNKNYYDLSQTERTKVNEQLDQKRKDEAKAGAIMLPNQPVPPKDWLSFSSFISKDPVMDRTSTIMSDAPAAIDIIKNSDKNSFSAASLPSAIAKLTGEGKNMSNQDIARYARAGGLADRLSQDVVGFFTGKKTDVTKEQAQQFATALYRGAIIERKNFIQDQAQSMGYDQSPNYKKTIDQLDKKLGQFKLIAPSAKTETPSTPVPKPEDEALINKYLSPKKP
jgi:hypothetical protein